jgi:predicted transcriptional regulator
VHADGGVNNVNAALLREEKVDVIISGSYLIKDKSIKKQLSLLLGGNYFKSIHYYSSKKIPKLNIKSKIIDALKKIDKYKMGIVLVFEKNKLKGLISDGDIRRYLIKKGSIYDETYNVINEKMIKLKNTSLIHSLREIKNIKNISAIPIMDKKEKCISIFRGLVK